MCVSSQKRDVSSEEKDKFPYDIVKMALPPEAQLAADAAEVRAEPLLSTHTETSSLQGE